VQARATTGDLQTASNSWCPGKIEQLIPGINGSAKCADLFPTKASKLINTEQVKVESVDVMRSP
jgi:hypothetical protein